MKILQQLQNLVDELNTTNSSNEKLEILKNYPQCREILFYTYNPYYQFNITSNNLKKRSDLDISELNHSCILSLLDDLRLRNITGHSAISCCNQFIKNNEQHKDLIYKILDKNLEVRLNAKSINKIFENLIPEFEVALCNKYEDRKDKINFENEEWFCSRKLDGCRCIIRKENGNISFWSRSGENFNTLNNLIDGIKKLDYDNVVLDGEICLLDKNGKENFQGIMKEIRKKEHTIQNPMYMIFDCLTLEEFDKKQSNSKLEARLCLIDDNINLNFPHLKKLKQIKIKSIEHLKEMQKQAIENNWEGLILRKNVGYEGKRTNNLLKVKQMQDAEFVVKDIEVGNFRIIDEKTGLEKTIQTVTNIIISYKENDVSVGSGFSLEQRNKFYKNPELIKDKVAIIQFFEETIDKNGNHSLRFPVFKYLYEGMRTI